MDQLLDKLDDVVKKMINVMEDTIGLLSARTSMMKNMHNSR